ncbi:type IV toxin-antitoxin system AbiEi family antitoxin domain-containing protein [Micromonospora okii]|uniref:type IV toxin-antitoxin system AbiEi family antitoxin domain-containing protein n=1 Tax=Micromonospora okii TaxID=1182970 RepID=UPI001E3D7116|nr:type IV toxin-antitoxin system AbiEi family antitoxin domain-containing protein [Micromonospora okii]
MVTTAQALAAGFTRDQIRQLCRSGRWTWLARGCFAPAGEPDRDAAHRARVRAAVVSLGPGAPSPSWTRRWSCTASPACAGPGSCTCPCPSTGHGRSGAVTPRSRSTS